MYILQNKSLPNTATWIVSLRNFRVSIPPCNTFLTTTVGSVVSFIVISKVGFSMGKGTCFP